MKKIIYLMIAAALIVCGCAEDAEKETAGSIYGVITDKATGEPVKSAGVQLNPVGTKTVTGSEGQYEFTGLKAGDYSLQVTKTGYTDLLNYKIKVAAGKTNKGDVQIEKLPPSLRVVNDSRQDISELDFGVAEDDVARSFSVFNDGPEPLEWEITKTAAWISAISKTDGTLNSGATQAVIVTIDRAGLSGGENVTTIHITSTNGSKQLTVKAASGRNAPTLNTLAVTDIAATTATFNGEITDPGAPAYTERGFVYATTTMPTLENTIARRTVAVTGEAKFFTGVLGLELGKTYFVRAYAINAVKTAYSTNEVSFTSRTVLPALTTDTVSNISIANQRATFNGTVLTQGDPVYTERGFVYGTVHNPTVEDDTKKPAAGSGEGAFSVNVTELQVGNIYYVRAYATNTAGTAYGKEITLDFNAVMPQVTTLNVTEITGTTAIFNGKIATVGDPAYTERGFVYGTMHNPTVADDTKKTVAGSGTGEFFANITGLTTSRLYYVRAYATNSEGTVYGTSVSFRPGSLNRKAQVSTLPVSDIAETSAVFNGKIDDEGIPAYTERGFVYSATFKNPTVDNDKKTVTGTGTGEFNANISGLTTGTAYYVRAYATNSEGTAYGASVSFKPESPNYVVLTAAGIMVQKTDITGNSPVNWSSGNSLYANSTLDGYTDWRLPTKDELATLYNERNTIGGFTTSSYWSSTHDGYYSYWNQDFSNGAQYTKSGGSSLRCRCVRTLP